MAETHLKKGEKIYVPGGSITLNTPGRCRLEVSPGVPFLREKAYLPESDATTDTRQVYFHLQEAYLATSDFSRQQHLQQYSDLAGALVDGNRSLLHFVDRIDTALDENNFFEALKVAKEFYEFEDLSLSHDGGAQPEA